MTTSYEEAVKAWREVSDFFLAQELRIESDFEAGRLSKWQRDRLQAQNRRDWDTSMILNNPHLEGRDDLKEWMMDGK